jgi:ATP-binding cassette subfamily F protein 3
MTLVALHLITKMFGARPILVDLEWTIEENARIGLIGTNGSGKSTLFRIITGDEVVEAGVVSRRRGLRVALLPQHIAGDERSPMQVALASRDDLSDLEAQLEACEAELSDPSVYSDMSRVESVLARQERLLGRFEALGGPGFEGEARSHLMAVGIEEADLHRPMSLLSGGQRKLVVLGACLAQRPDLMLLDEPETHLDLPHREQLEELIQGFSGTVVVVSHDRYLLDDTVSEIAELDKGKITHWPGNYSAYAVARELALARQQQLYSAQQQEIDRLEEAIRRFKYWAHITVNERHIRQARVKQQQIDQMEKVDRPVLERRKIGLRLRSATRGGQKVLELRGVDMAFHGELVLRDLNLTIRRGERVGIVGPNGAGKTVLARILTGLLQPTGGEAWCGPSIEVGYFAQNQETLPPEQSPLELVRRTKPVAEGEAVSVLLRFLFSYEQIRQRVRSLSGGERSRLQLLLLMLGGANCLVLDEPTNHLDIDSAEVLEGALEQFDGTVIAISHDRYFLDRIADRIIEIASGEVALYEGGYGALLHERQHSPVHSVR